MGEGSFWRCDFIYPQYCTISYFDNVLNKINIISAAEGLRGINVSDEYFLIRGRVIFGNVFLLIPNIAQFSFARKKKKKDKKKKKKEKGKKKKKKKKKKENKNKTE